MKQYRQVVTAAALMLASGGASLASPGQAVPIPDRARGAERIVVATVAATNARYERNDFGDDLIVTRAQLAVEEVIKGHQGPVTLAIEGGTVEGITLRVSDLPEIKTGERAVFFLAPGANGEFKPHLRGQGILKLDSGNRVQGSSLTVDEVRRLARGNQ
jgi:hypothetical protein